MDYFKIVLFSVFSFVSLFISAKLIGNKQMSDFNLFDYINGITIGSIAAEMATNLESSPVFPLIGIAMYTLLVMLFNFISEKSIKVRRFFNGKNIVLMQNNKMFPKNFKTGKIEIGEFMTQCHVNGYFNIDQIETAILEQNGKISFMPKSSSRAVTPEDLNIAVKKEKPDIAIIEDGVVLEENLKLSGNNEDWLKAQLQNLNIKNPEGVFLAVCNSVENKLYVYKKNDEAPQNDPFQ